VGPYEGDRALVAALQAGDEDAFRQVVDRHGGSMRRVALSFVRVPAVADEVVQEAWVGVLRGIDRFEGRSSFPTWLHRIVANTAKTRAEREGRSIPFSSVGDGGPSVDPDRFEHGEWSDPPASWASLPESKLVSAETRALIAHAIDELPHAQRVVISLRDVEGWPSEEVCNALEISESNQRVLLHRARSKVRAELEEYLR
jgi:RNA polymerase sigma-70 factor (ECF subfamily)